MSKLRMTSDGEPQITGPRRLTAFGTDFEIFDTAGEISIERNGSKYEVLCALEDHPHCAEAEDYFIHASLYPEQMQQFHPNQTIKIYLRDQAAFKVEAVTFQADITVKMHGVQSARVVAPKSLKGLLLSPDPQENGAWIVFRPFKESNRGKGKTV
ncbi:hypothetical protein HY605_04520, partial [Candidatus Peregrinibacteria bacterium]|nr:hypothetical protein [Candidatus Peregrinibacteria bacterium]